jgi:hypothetical protein
MSQASIFILTQHLKAQLAHLAMLREYHRSGNENPYFKSALPLRMPKKLLPA